MPQIVFLGLFRSFLLLLPLLEDAFFVCLSQHVLGKLQHFFVFLGAQSIAWVFVRVGQNVLLQDVLEVVDHDLFLQASAPLGVQVLSLFEQQSVRPHVVLLQTLGQLLVNFDKRQGLFAIPDFTLLFMKLRDLVLENVVVLLFNSLRHLPWQQLSWQVGL